MSAQLHEQLARLHSELARTTNVDDASRALLVTLLADITRLLEISGGRTEEDRDASLPERMEKVAVGFEAEHPNLSAAIRGVIEALARAGI
jgi:ABC-type uncharacterized transport system substrate-binding protein